MEPVRFDPVDHLLALDPGGRGIADFFQPGAAARAAAALRSSARVLIATGFVVDPDELLWWNVLANYKLSVITLTGVGAFVDGRFDRIHQAPMSLSRVMFDMIGA